MQARNSGRDLVLRQLRALPSAPTGILRAMKFMASIERTRRLSVAATALSPFTISILYTRYRALVRSQYGDASHERSASVQPACLHRRGRTECDPGCAGVRHSLRPQLRPSGQRHLAVVDSGNLHDFESGVTARLRSHRPDHTDQPAHRVLTATVRRHVHRQTSAAVLARARNG